MQYLLPVVATWALLVGVSDVCSAEALSNGRSEVTQEPEVFADEGKQEATAEPLQPPSDGKLTKEQLRALIRAKRERLRAEMKARRESLRAEGAELQQEIMAKKARMHISAREAAEVIAQPANEPRATLH